jgi:hypothetical protein
MTKTSQNFAAHGGILLTPIGMSDCQLSRYLSCAAGFKESTVYVQSESATLCARYRYFFE